MPNNKEGYHEAEIKLKKGQTLSISKVTVKPYATFSVYEKIDIYTVIDRFEIRKQPFTADKDTVIYFAVLGSDDQKKYKGTVKYCIIK